MISVSLQNIQYQYPLTQTAALRDVSFDFEEGKFYGVIGANGSGKTTICNLITGLIPDFYGGELRGEVLIQGKPIAEWDKRALCTKVGYIFQNPFTQISGIRDTVLEEIVIGLENLGLGKNEMLKRAEDVAKQIDIYDIIGKNPNELSGGQRQRVAFASILAMDTDIYVIDEPTSQLDPEGTENVFRIIASLKERKKTVILVEHKIEQIAKYADEVLAIHDGQIVRSGKTDEVLADFGLLEQGITLPQSAILGREMQRAGKPLEHIPVTMEDAFQLILSRRQ